MDPRWVHPWSAIVAGPSSCGKSYFVKNFINYIEDMSDVKFPRIIWYYSESQPLYRSKELKSVEFQEGLPSCSDFTGEHPILIIIDDMMRESNEQIVDIFTKGCHHKNLSVFFITQNIFHQGRGQRDISLNANYIVLFKNPRDRAQIQHLARQVYPTNPRFLQDAYYDATLIPHGYLLLDLKQATPENCRVRTCLFPNDPAHIVYVPKEHKTNGTRRR